MKKNAAIIVGLLVIFIASFIATHNSFQTARINVETTYGQIDSQMQRRADFTPNLVNTVKGYLQYEESQLNAVTTARTKILNARSPEDLSAADTEFSAALRQLLELAENYPELKSNGQFTSLMREVSGTESRMAAARKEYNEAVGSYNTQIQIFPGVFFSNLLGMKPLPQFKGVETAKNAQKLTF